MKKYTRLISCALVIAFLFCAAVGATGCGRNNAYPTVSEATEPQSVGEVIPAVDRQQELKAAKKNNSDTVAWLYMPGADVDDSVLQAKDNAYYL